MSGWKDEREKALRYEWDELVSGGTRGAFYGIFFNGNSPFPVPKVACIVHGISFKDQKRCLKDVKTMRKRGDCFVLWQLWMLKAVIHCWFVGIFFGWVDHCVTGVFPCTPISYDIKAVCSVLCGYYAALTCLGLILRPPGVFATRTFVVDPLGPECFGVERGSMDQICT